MRRFLRRSLSISLAAAAAYLTLIVFPDPLFAYSHQGDFVVVHADAPIPDAAGAVLRDAEARVRRSPLFVPDVTHDIYVSQSAWRWHLLANFAQGSGAMAMAPFGRAMRVDPR